MIDTPGQESIGLFWVVGLYHSEQATVLAAYDHTYFAVTVSLVEGIKQFFRG